MKGRAALPSQHPACLSASVVHEELGLAFSAACAYQYPFLGQVLYVNPVNAKEVDTSIATAASCDVKANLQRMQRGPES